MLRISFHRKNNITTSTFGLKSKENNENVMTSAVFGPRLWLLSACVVALYFRFPTYLYLKLRFVSNNFWTNIPKTSHCAPMHFFAFAFAVLKS